MRILHFMLSILLIVFIGGVSLNIALAPIASPNTAPTLSDATSSIPHIITLPQTPPVFTPTPPQPKISPQEDVPLASPIYPVVTQPESPPPTNDELYAYALARTVNLLCQKANDEITIATAFFVSNTGILLTNGHVTENLLSNECTVRQGAPAQEIGTAHLRYLPREYTATTSYSGQIPYDISLWSYTPNSSSSLHAPFPYFAFDATLPASETVVTTFSYPVELAAFRTILNNQYPLFSDATIVHHDHIALALSASAGAQKGSSGGVVMNPKTMSALGIIFGVSGIGPVSDRTLYALTFERINAIILREFGISFAEKLTQLHTP